VEKEVKNSNIWIFLPSQATKLAPKV
jgi:hypothetical protein